MILQRLCNMGFLKLFRVGMRKAFYMKLFHYNLLWTRLTDKVVLVKEEAEEENQEDR